MAQGVGAGDLLEPREFRCPFHHSLHGDLIDVVAALFS